MHTDRPVITPERIAWFADYYRAHPSWGVFHVWLDDGNYTLPYDANDLVLARYPADVVEAGRWFARLSPSQRKRLGQRAVDLAHTIRRTT